MTEPIVYLDNNATTAVAPQVREAMLPFLHHAYGNPSSIHTFGGVLHKKIDHAREQMAELLHAKASEILFTSGGTESDNAAIRGVLEANPEKRHLITTKVEHPAVLNLCQHLEHRGYRVTYLPVDQKGRLDLDALREAIQPDTALVSIMTANNETGTLFPIERIAEIVKQRGVVFHTDAVQAAGKVPLDMNRLAADLVSVSGHKLHAAKGVGALYIRRGTRFVPFMIGGHQEHGRRGGTENVGGIVGMGLAAEIAGQGLLADTRSMAALRDRLEQEILGHISEVKINGDPENRLPNTTNISFSFIEGEAILLRLDESGICASSGSACTSGSLEPSHVLRAMGVPFVYIHGSIRLSLSRFTTASEIDTVLSKLPGIVEELRSMSPFWKNRENATWLQSALFSKPA